MITLYIHYPEQPEAQKIEVPALPCPIGRHPENKVVLTHKSISSHHAVLEQRTDGIYLKDLGSTNGTKLQNQKITETKITGKVDLFLGDIRVSVVEEVAVEKTVVSALGFKTTFRHYTWTTKKIALGMALYLALNIFSAQLSNGPILGKELYVIYLGLGFTIFFILGVAFVCALISKIFMKESRFGIFMTTLTYWGLFSTALNLLNPELSFNLALLPGGKEISMIAGFVIAGLFLCDLSLKLFFKARAATIILSIVAGLLSFTFVTQKLVGEVFSSKNYLTVLSYPMVPISKEQNGINKIQAMLQESAKQADDDAREVISSFR
jgi:hypothetical protein